MADPLLQLARPKRKRLTHVPSNHLTARPRIGDDLLDYLAPSTVVEALTAPTGALRTCLEAASDPDRDFAKRSALASQRVWQWLAELEDWAWPPAAGPAGFVDSQAWRTEGDDEFMSSLSAADVARYGRRIDEIHHQMDELAVEDIKSHVLTNHIAPLSRPCTPVTNSTCHSSSSVSSSCYNEMNDLTAITTAIVLQTLPDLARLSCLLRIWTSRLQVLQRIPRLLHAIADAETGLELAWAYAAPPTSGGSHSTIPEALQQPPLSRQGFEAMRRSLAAKVAEPGPILDGMLDCLEGMPDTLPDSYISRVEAVERDYSDWAAVCERRMRENHWSTLNRAQSRPRSAYGLQHDGSETSSRPSSSGLPELSADDELTLPALPKDEHGGGARDHDEDIATEWESSSPCNRNAGDESPTASSCYGSTVSGSGSPGPRMPSGRRSINYGVNDRTRVTSSQSDAPSLMTDDGEASTVRGTKSETGHDSVRSSPGSDRAMTPVEDMEEPELPRLRESVSQSSLSSQASTLVFGDSSHFGALSSDPLEMPASPAGLADRIHHAHRFDDSPPRTPPRLLKSDSLELSADLFDGLVVSPPEGDASMFFKSPADQPFVDAFDDAVSTTGSLSQGERGGAQQLEQQISEIIESIPAKIRLFSEPAPVNLNPPDLRLPRLRKKPSKEHFRRSASNLSVVSSRGGTPSFTLSPAKQLRAKQKKTQQEIQVYHLARSTGEAPIKLFVRCVGERGERVMVRVGGGWADLSEYLKEYVSHHGRRSVGTNNTKVEVRDVARASAGLVPQIGSSPSRPGSAAAESSPVTPLRMHKASRTNAANTEALRLRPRPMTPAGGGGTADFTPAPPASEDSARSRSSSRLSWYEDDSSFLGLAGPTGKKVEMSEENRAWVESVKEKVRLASGEHRGPPPGERTRFGELSKVGGTKRLFRQADDRSWR